MKKPTVLLVDDEPNILHGLKRSLHGQPFEVISAGSAEEALEVLAHRSVDVVVSDEQMTGISGTDLLRKIRLSYPSILRFVLTGRANLDTAVRAINQGGVCRFFLKPCHAIELVVAIRQELEKRDLIVASQHLLQKVKLQAVQIETLEKEYGDIAKVRRDVDGTILLEDIPEDVSELVIRICEQIGKP